VPSIAACICAAREQRRLSTLRFIGSPPRPRKPGWSLISGPAGTRGAIFAPAPLRNFSKTGELHAQAEDQAKFVVTGTASAYLSLYDENQAMRQLEAWSYVGNTEGPEPG